MTIKNNCLFNMRKFVILLSMPSITLLIVMLKLIDDKNYNIHIHTTISIIIACFIINILPIISILPDTTPDVIEMSKVTIESQGMSFLGLYLSIWFIALSITGIYTLVSILIFIFFMQLFLHFNYYSIILLFCGYRYYKVTDKKNSYILISNNKNIKQLKTNKEIYRINDFTFLYKI